MFQDKVQRQLRIQDIHMFYAYVTKIEYAKERDKRKFAFNYGVLSDLCKAAGHVKRTMSLK